MSECAQFKRRISRYIDNDLNELDKRGIELHCASCPACGELLASYRRLKHHIRNGFGPAGYADAESDPVSRAKVKVDPFTSRTVRLQLAALLALTAILLSGIILKVAHRAVRPFPVIIERESCRIMNSPLGTLVYYQELAGAAVHLQYGTIEGISGAAYGDTGSDGSSRFIYESPLFADNAYVGNHYASIQNSSFF